MTLDPESLECPYCGAAVDLFECWIVATNHEPMTGVRSAGRETVDAYVAAGAGDRPAASNLAGPNMFAGVDTSLLDDPDDLDDPDGGIESDPDAVDGFNGSAGALDRHDERRAVDVRVAPAGSPKLTNQPVSGTEPIDQIGEFPVLAKPPWTSPQSESETALALGFHLDDGTVPEPHEFGQPEDMPARICMGCQTPLPMDLWRRPVKTIALVGTNLAGKTHFLASSLHQGYRQQQLAPLGFSEFQPDEDTNIRLNEEYFTLFTGAHALPKTQAAKTENVRFQPLTVRFTVDGRRGTALFHDVAGEHLRDPRGRRRVARYIPRAAGIVFLIDPVGYPHIREATGIGAGGASLAFSQDQIVEGIANDLGEERLATIPVAFAITKADLLCEVFPDRDYWFKHPAATDPPSAWNQIHHLSQQTEQIIWHDLQDPALVNQIRRFAQRTLHCIAPIGTRPANDGSISHLAPIRVTEPLFSVLTRV